MKEGVKMLSIITKESEEHCAASIAGKPTIIEVVTALKAVQKVFAQNLRIPKDEIKIIMNDIIDKDL